MPAVVRRVEALYLDESRGTFKSSLLETIRCPKNLHYLSERLPDSNYDKSEDVERSKTNEASERKKMQGKKKSNFTLMKQNKPVIGSPPRQGAPLKKRSTNEEATFKEDQVSGIGQTEQSKRSEDAVPPGSPSKDVKSEHRKGSPSRGSHAGASATSNTSPNPVTSI